MNRIRKGVLALALMVGLIGWSGPGWTADPGVTDTEVVLGAWFPLTGFLSFTGTSDRISGLRSRNSRDNMEAASPMICRWWTTQT